MLRLSIIGDSGCPAWAGLYAISASSERAMRAAPVPAKIVDGQGVAFPKDSPSRTAIHDYSRLPRIPMDAGDAFSLRAFCFGPAGHPECWKRPAKGVPTIVQAFTSRGMYE